MGSKVVWSAMMVLAGALTTLITKYQVLSHLPFLHPDSLPCASVAKTSRSVGYAMRRQLQLIDTV